MKIHALCEDERSRAAERSNPPCYAITGCFPSSVLIRNKEKPRAFIRKSNGSQIT